VYEGDVRFEHCYRLDEERRVHIGEKLTCWREWSQKYTYGQTRDRIEYALARERTLAQAQASGERSAPPGASVGLAATSPQPTNAFAPPPPTMTRDAGTDTEQKPAVAALMEPALGPLPSAPGASCGGGCGKTWVQCVGQCKGGNCQSACDDRYKSCMRGCF
jgi:hypothetical protein